MAAVSNRGRFFSGLVLARLAAVSDRAQEGQLEGSASFPPMSGLFVFRPLRTSPTKSVSNRTPPNSRAAVCPESESLSAGTTSRVPRARSSASPSAVRRACNCAWSKGNRVTSYVWPAGELSAATR